MGTRVRLYCGFQTCEFVVIPDRSKRAIRFQYVGDGLEPGIHWSLMEPISIAFVPSQKNTVQDGVCVSLENRVWNGVLVHGSPKPVFSS
jgi:hypothetical protein